MIVKCGFSLKIKRVYLLTIIGGMIRRMRKTGYKRALGFRHLS